VIYGRNVCELFRGTKNVRVASFLGRKPRGVSAVTCAGDSPNHAHRLKTLPLWLGPTTSGIFGTAPDTVQRNTPGAHGTSAFVTTDCDE